MIYIPDVGVYINPLHIEAVELTNVLNPDGSGSFQWGVFIYTSREKYGYYCDRLKEAKDFKDSLINKVDSYLDGLKAKNM